MKVLIVVVLGIMLLLVPSTIFWLIWTVWGLGAVYFNFLPEQFHSIPFFHCFGLITILSFIGKIVSGQSAIEVKK